MKIGKKAISSSIVMIAVLMMGVLIIGCAYIKNIEKYYRVKISDEFFSGSYANNNIDVMELDKDLISYKYTIPTLSGKGVVGVFVVKEYSDEVNRSIIITKEKIDYECQLIMNRFRRMYLSFTVLCAVVLILLYIMERSNIKKVEKLAYTDEITGGKSFLRFKEEALELIKSNAHEYVLADLDVDKFKNINDVFGFEEGNNVIRFIWDIVNAMLEEKECFAHYRGDRFVILMVADDMDRVISRLEKLAARAKEGSSNEKNYEIELSIGLYPVEERNIHIDTMLDRTALTKKAIKGMHNQLYAIYDENIRQKVLRDQEIENMMERALVNNEFMVYYQPKYSCVDCLPVGAEALVRWYNEEVGMIYPNEFIPVFEENGFIAELDKYMFEHVCSDIRHWLDEGCLVVPVSVNLSQLQLYNTRFIDEYMEIMDKYNISPEHVQLELTETTLFSEITALSNIIDKLHEKGFKILMDDFGTGYSSLNMLKNVPVDILKLDKSFVDDIGAPKGDIVVSTIVSLGQMLDMKIVAEGVETKEQYEFLRDIFCDEIQGYYFSKPISSDEYRKKMVKVVE